jgi:hypothetical protein
MMSHLSHGSQNFFKEEKNGLKAYMSKNKTIWRVDVKRLGL